MTVHTAYPRGFFFQSGDGAHVTAATAGAASHHHLETISLDERKEVHMGSLGLGTALAVAYDLYNDGAASGGGSNAAQYHPQQLTGFIQLSALKAAGAPTQLNTTNIPQQQQQQHFLAFSHPATAAMNGSVSSSLSSSVGLTPAWTTQHLDAYLTPISLTCASPTKTVLPPQLQPHQQLADQSRVRIQHINHHLNNNGTNGAGGVDFRCGGLSSSSSSSFLTDPSAPVAVVVPNHHQQQHSNYVGVSSLINRLHQESATTTTPTSSLLPPPAIVSSIATMSSTTATVLSHPPTPLLLQAPTTADSTDSGSNHSFDPHHHLLQPDLLLHTTITPTAAAPANGTESANSLAVDDNMYEISDEEMREIDASVSVWCHVDSAVAPIPSTGASFFVHSFRLL